LSSKFRKILKRFCETRFLPSFQNRRVTRRGLPASSQRLSPFPGGKPISSLFSRLLFQWTRKKAELLRMKTALLEWQLLAVRQPRYRELSGGHSSSKIGHWQLQTLFLLQRTKEHTGPKNTATAVFPCEQWAEKGRARVEPRDVPIPRSREQDTTVRR
jgi:hypothetical protein